MFNKILKHGHVNCSSVNGHQTQSTNLHFNKLVAITISFCLVFGWCSQASAFDVLKSEIPLPSNLNIAIQQIDFEKYDVRPIPIQYDYDSIVSPAFQPWGDFSERHRGPWRIELDSRTRAPLLIEGKGIPLVPGNGNQLNAPAFGVAGPARRDPTDLLVVSRVAEAFIEQQKNLLQVGEEEFVLDEKASGGFGKNNRFWALRYQHVFRDPDVGLIPVRGAYVFLRLSHGNLIQFGNQQVVTPQNIQASNIITQQTAVQKALDLLGSPSDTEMLHVARDVGQVDRSLQIVPFIQPDGSLGHQLVRAVWVVTDILSIELWFDSQSGDLVYAIDKRSSADAIVRGGIYPITNTDVEVFRGFPYLKVINNGSTKSTDESGVYFYFPSGSLATAELEGDYVLVNDDCGSASVSTSLPPGDLSFGMGVGTDCATPGFGGAGNTHAARSSFYHLNLIKDKARYYLGVTPTDTHWLNNQLESRTNISGDCNAYWDGTRLKFYQVYDVTAAGYGQCPTDATVDYVCSNTGEISAVFLHEFGHGLDQNTNGAPPDNASGEAYSDIMAFLQTHDSCIGNNFAPNCPCQFGCDSGCTGVRDVSVTPAVSPSTIENSPADCDRWACPYYSGFSPYLGPMGYQGHCESLIASGAVWDMIQGFVGRYGDGAGWALGDRIWYESLNSTGSAYQLASGVQCDIAASVDGCGADNWYTVFLALDDDDGDITNGTPNADIIWNAFNDHGIACGTAAPPVSTICPPIATPVLNAVPTSGQVALSWGSVADAASYRIFRNEFGCSQGFTPIADIIVPTTTFDDEDVSNGTTYYYAVQTIGANDICVSSFSTCVSATPPAPLNPANVFMVLDQSGSMNGATDVSGETKMQALKDASNMVVDLIDDYAADGFRIGGVAFSTTVTDDTGGLLDPSDTSPGGDRSVLDAFITSLTPTNLTAIGQGVNAATGGFPSPSDGLDKVVMLLSDGMQNVPPNLELNSPPPGVGVGGTPLPNDIRFYSVALGTQIQEDLFDDLANQGGIPCFYYSGGTTDIQQNFVFWAADVLGLDPSGSPFSTSPGSGFAATPSSPSSPAPNSQSIPFLVNRTARRITFVLTWSSKGRDLRFYLDTPVGRLDPPASSFHSAEGYAAFTVSLPLRDDDAEAHLGEWILRVTDSQRRQPTAFQAFALFDDPAILLDYDAGGSDPVAGEALPIRIRVLENGRPLSGLSGRVIVEGPETGLGELLSSAPHSSIKPFGAPQARGGDPVPDPATAKLSALLEKDPEFLRLLPGNIVTLFETAPGVYEGEFPQNLTGPAGTYVLTFEVEGYGVVNDSFQRTNRFSRYLRLKPTIDNTVARAEAMGSGDMKRIAVSVTPRDKLDNRLGPGWYNQIQGNTNAGNFEDQVVDNLDGTYTLKLRIPKGSNPKVTVNVRGETIVDDKVNNLLRGNWVSIHGGSAVPLGSYGNNYGPGPSIFFDYEYSISPKLTALAMVGYNRFKASTANVNDTFWWNVSLNLKYNFELGSLLPFINAGPGFFKPENGSNEFGFNLGAGVGYRLRPGLRLELGAGYYNVVSGSTDIEFLVPHVGLVYRY